MARITCHYKFPCHPVDMFQDTPKRMTKETRMLRVHLINQIADLSQQFPQNKLDDCILIDVERGSIVGMDMMGLMFPGNMCIGDKQIRLGQMTSVNWKTMRVA